HKLDSFVEQVLIPEHTRGARRRFNPVYRKLSNAIARGRKRGDRAVVRELRKQRRLLPSGDPRDPGYRRLRYARYADLCRRRHKSAYAEYRIMPSAVV
ncbi:MAG: hypothetical protein ACRDQ9_13275, partial [Pseudonocardiaceae bacterium]